MSQQTINIGSAPNDGTGDYIRDAFDKANDNFTELYTALTGLLDFKGTTDCSANPNYPAALKGDFYLVSVAGKIGGASGIVVEAGDNFFATADNAGGTQASVGSSWTVIQGNITSATLVSDTVYGAGWNGDTTVAPSKNAVYDKIEAVIAGSATVSDTVYGAGWNGDTTVAPSKNAVYDKIEAVIAGVPGAYTDEQAQDAIGAMIDTSLTYVDGTPLLQVNQANLKPTEHIQIACSDETTALTTGTAKVTFRMPYAFTLTDVRGSLKTAQASGSIFTVDINESGTSVISTKLTIDNTEKTSTTAATPSVISDSSLADDAEMTVDIDQIGDGTAKGLKIILIGHRT